MKTHARRTRIAALAALLLLATLPDQALAQPGSLDPTFGTDGITRIGFGDGTDASWALTIQSSDSKYLVAGSAGAYLAVARYHYSGAPDLTFGEQGVARLWDLSGAVARGVVVQSDGRIVVAGSTGYGNGNDNGPLVARFLTDGSIDASFGVGGFAVIPDSLEFSAVALVMQGSQILVAGSIDGATSASQFAVCRLTASGFLDPTFDGDGVQSTTMPNGGSASAMTLQPDGKIVLAGHAYNGGSGYAMGLVRYDANGALDTSFDGDGRVITNVGSSTNATLAYAIIPMVFSANSVRLLVAGRTGPASPQGDGLLVRYNLDGSLDTVFGSGGVVVQSVSTGTDVFRAVRYVIGTTHANPTRIYVGGYMNSPTANYDALLCCYTVSGALYTNFGGGDGIVTTPIGGGQDEIWGMLLSGDRLVVTGYASYGEEGQNFMLARFLASTGALDPTLDGDGILLDDIADATSGATAMVRQPDGRIVLVGYNSSGSEQVLARLKADGSLDPSFSGDGKATLSIGTGTEYLLDVALQADQKIVAVGTAILSNRFSLTMSRFLPDGTLDPTFNGSGTVTTRMGSDDYNPTVAIQPDGRILLAGYFEDPDSVLIRVSRYLSNGQVDASFGNGGHRRLKGGSHPTYDANMALQGDGHIVVAGRRERYVNQVPVHELVVFRLTATGALDPTFGSGGLAIPLIPAGARRPTDVLVQPDGYIVVTGYDYITGSNRDPWALRLDDVGQLDPTFGNQGYQVISTSPVDESVLAAAFQADGRLLLAGRTGTDYLNDQFVARTGITGLPDHSFAGDGLLDLDCGPAGYDLAYDILAGDPGPILVAGTSRGLMCVSGLEQGPAQTGVGDPLLPARPALAVGQPWPSPTHGGMSMTLQVAEPTTGVAEPAAVSTEVLDVNGRLIRTLGTAERLAAGEHRIAWDGRDAAGSLVAAGIYFVRIRANDHAMSRRVVVVR